MSLGPSDECIDRTRLDAPRSPGTSGWRRGIAGRRGVVRARPGGCFGLASQESAALLESGGRRPSSSRHDELQSLDLTQQLLDRIAAVDGRLQSYVTVMTDQAIASARRADAEIRGRPVPRASPWRAHRGERPLLYARRSHHGGHEGLCRLRARLRRDRRRAAGSCRCGHPGQARPVRRCVRSVLSRPAGAGEPVGRHTVERRVIEWLRRGDGSGLVLCVGRYGHGRIDPVPIGRERMRGAQAHVWPSEPLRRVRAGAPPWITSGR